MNSTIPSIGTRVSGKHLLGRAYSGVIVDRRAHTLDANTWLFFIRFDSPTELAEGDVRTDICVSAVGPIFSGDTQWQDGAGGYFCVVIGA